MKFRYIGAYPNGAQSLDAYGKTFSPGVEHDLEGVMASKARGNRFFEPVIDDADVIYYEPVKLELHAPELALELSPAPDTAPDVAIEEQISEADDTTTATFDRESLIATAEQFGIPIDKRWKSERIAAAIISHSNAQHHTQGE
jgi:hypothetical protein